MSKRLASSIVLVVLVVPLVLFANTIALNIVVAIISAVCVYEALIATKYVEGRDMMFVCILLSLLLPFMPYLNIGVSMPATPYVFLLALLMFVFTIINYRKYKFEHVCVVFMLAVIIPYFFTNMVMLGKGDYGQFYIALIFTGAFTSDSCAFAVGKLFGKHRFVPDISPKKTVEGAVGGFLLTGVAFFLFGLVVENAFGMEVNYVALVLAGLGASVMGQLGDLSMSIIKRTFAIKDFGNLIPGHGGMLDRFDSIIFISPYLYALTRFVELFWLPA